MLYPSVDKILNTVDSKYQLVHIIAKRSKELTREKNYQKPVKRYFSKKNLGKALEEVSGGYIIIKEKAQ